MFVGRKKELATLNEVYEKDAPSLVILYGRDGIGKTRLLKEFSADKSHMYYLGREYSKEEQKQYLDPVLEETRVAAASLENGKICLFIDEFDQIQKAYKDFFVDLEAFLKEELIEKRVMVVISSSSIQWVENEMVKVMGTTATRITSFIKLKEFTFLEMVSYFPDSSTQDCIAIFGVLGGVPKYLEYWDSKKNVRENIKKLFLYESSPMRNEVVRFLRLDLRELSVYNTILAVLAEDEYKLNYLYSRTGFSRAKISVYIKNLIQLDVAHKIFSFETDQRENIQKGLYGISDPLLYFWYKFMQPNLSSLAWEDADAFYDSVIEPGLDGYMWLSYIRVCREFLELMNQFGKLPIQIHTMGSLYGKEGFIPLIGQSQEGELLVGTCKWSNEPMTVTEFEELLGTMEQTGKEADYYFLFSKEGFAQELSTMTQGIDNVSLIDLESL